MQDAVMALEFLQEDVIGVQRDIHNDGKVLQSHRIRGGLEMIDGIE